MKNAIVSKVKAAVLTFEPSAEVILFGSRARDDFREHSDWDLQVLIDGLLDTVCIGRIRTRLQTTKGDYH